MHACLSVVIATKDRRHQLLESLARLTTMPERPHIIVVDNGSTDGTSGAVRATHPEVRVIQLPHNIGAVARNIGVAAACTRYVAFADDDSWWEPGSLRHAERLLDAYDDLAVIAARVVVEPSGCDDPLSSRMAQSPLPPRPHWPGPPVLGFLACAAVLRRVAFTQVGGFDDLLFFLGEEELLAYDLAARGWGLVYVDDIVAHHQPAATARDPGPRRTRQLRNEVLVGLMRRPMRVALARTAALCRASRADPAARQAVIEAALRLPTALLRRRPPVVSVERDLELLTKSSTSVQPQTVWRRQQEDTRRQQVSAVDAGDGRGGSV